MLYIKHVINLHEPSISNSIYYMWIRVGLIDTKTALSFECAYSSPIDLK